MSQHNQELSPAMREAIELFQSGRTVDAEQRMLTAVREAEEQFGTDSREYAIAQNELGTILLNVGQNDRAVDAYYQACAGPMPTDKDARRDRLTFLMNLGQALELSNKLDEAEEVFRKGLDGRREFYGADHPGYAFGLEPLASVLLHKEKWDEAGQVIQETVDIFWRHRHPRLATALALRAEILAAQNSDTPAFANLDELPDEYIEEIASHALFRIDHTDARLSRRVLAELTPVLEKRFGADHRTTLNVLITRANLERSVGEAADRQATIRRVIESFDRLGRDRDVLQSMLGLALAQSEAGDQEAALSTYAEALQRAERMGNPVLRSQVLRNWGICLSEMKRDEEAEEKLVEAASAAKESGDPEMMGRAGVALGIFHQHRDRIEKAKELLEPALETMNPAHPDAITGRSHLHAIERGESCGCDDMGQAMAQAFRAFVLEQLPADMIDRFDVEWKDGDFDLSVYLSREPTPEEAEHMQRIVHHALEEFRRRAREAG